MRVLVCTRPFHGHLNPMLPVVDALVSAGHDVRVATHPSLAGWVGGAGLAFVPAGIDPRRRDPRRDENPEHPGWNAWEVGDKVRDLLTLHETWAPDVVMREQTDFGALLYAEAVGVPVAMLGPAMYVPPASWIKLYGPRMDEVRDSLGLPPDPAFERMNPWLYLDPTPLGYQTPLAAALAVRHETRPVPLGHGQEAPDWVAALPRRRTAYLTFGTVYNRRPRMLRAAVEGLLAEGFEVVTTAGPGADLPTLDLPDDERVHAVAYLQQGKILPHCAVVVNHGGFGSVMGALWHGLPQVVVPLGSDNPTHAARILALGTGTRLWARDVSPESIATSVRAVLEPEVRQRARALGRRVRAMPAPAEGAALVERLVIEGAPVRRVPTGDRKRPRTAVAIPVLGRPELTRALLDDVAREPWVDPVVVDNGGDHVPVHGERVLRPGRNLGWAGACNLALADLMARGYDAAVLLNNDTRLSPGFFAGLWRAHGRTQAALLGPAYDGTWPHQQGRHAGDAATYRGGHGHRDVPFLDGTCLFVPRRTWEDVGSLDADSFPEHGWGVDLDYALRVRAAGGRVVVTDEAFLHHEGGATASAQGDDWKLRAWEELVVGMRRLYGLAWPRLLRDPDATPRPANGVPADRALCPPVVVVASPGSGARTVHRALNLLGVAPAPDPDQRRLDRLAAELGLDSGSGYVPGTPDELLGAPALAAALGEVRETMGEGARLDRPTLWLDPTGGALVPFLAAAYDVDPVSVLVVRNPLDVADELRVEGGTDRRTGLAVWERRLRLALHSLVGLPVVVTRLEDLVRLPAAWSQDLHRSLAGLAVPLIAEVGEHEVVAAMSGAVRSARHVDVRTTTSEQEELYATLLGLTGSHARFPEIGLGPESPEAEDLLSRVARPSGPPLTLGPDWVDWVAENRGAGIADSELLAVLVQRGIEPAEGRRALACLGANGRSNGGNPNGHTQADTGAATYRSVNERAWDLLSGTTEDFGSPVTRADLPGARAELEGPLPIPWEGITRVLCLAGGGGRQAALFASLGLDVVVADLSSEQLALDRAAARRLGLTLETVQGDMADLSVLGGRRFDLVHQPVSLCYVPDPAAVFAEVARVLEPGGHYWVESWNPVQMQLDGLGRGGPPYRLVRPQGAERPVRFGVAAEELEQAGPEVAWHYVHPLSTLLGSLCEAGFEIADLQERRYGDPTAPAGTEAHLEAFVPPFFAVLARRVGGAG